MNTPFLIDTNAALYFLDGKVDAKRFGKHPLFTLLNIQRLELFVKPNLSHISQIQIANFIRRSMIIPVDDLLIDAGIAVCQAYSIKGIDALVAAAALE